MFPKDTLTPVSPPLHHYGNHLGQRCTEYGGKLILKAADIPPPCVGVRAVLYILYLMMYFFAAGAYVYADILC